MPDLDSMVTKDHSEAALGIVDSILIDCIQEERWPSQRLVSIVAAEIEHADRMKVGSGSAALVEVEPAELADFGPAALAEVESAPLANVESAALAEVEPAALAEVEPAALAEIEPAALAEVGPADWMEVVS